MTDIRIFQLPCILSGLDSKRLDFSTIRSGVDFYLVQFLAHRFNFTYSIIDGNMTFGSKQPNGSMDGVVGFAERGDADFSIGSVSMTTNRFEAVQFSVPYIYDPITFMLPRVYAFESGPLFTLDVSLMVFILNMVLSFLLTVLLIRKLFKRKFCWELYCNFMSKGN